MIEGASYYSVSVWLNDGEVELPEYATLLEPGLNVFHVLLREQDVPSFRQRLAREGVTIRSMVDLRESHGGPDVPMLDVVPTTEGVAQYILTQSDEEP